MTDEKADEILILLRELVEETKKHSQALEDVKNLFIKYDADLLMEDEYLRNG